MARKYFTAGVRCSALDFIPAALKSKCARYLGDRRGAVAIIYAAALPGLVGMVGLGVETGYWYVAKRNLQTEADAAALGAGWKDVYGGSAAEVEAAALNEAVRNGFEDTPATDVDVNNPPLYGAYAGDTSSTEVILTEEHELMFASVVYDSVVTIAARAVVDVQPAEDACILALSTTASQALDIGGNTTISMPDCVLASNSTYCPDAAIIDGSATVTAYTVWTSGCYFEDSSNPVTLAEPGYSNAPPIDDPYATATVPPLPGGACQNWNAQGVNKPAGSKYCNNVVVNNNEVVHFSPGVYWFNNANWTVNGGAMVDCPTCTVGGDGVLIVFTGPNSNQVGSLTINGGADVDLNGISAAQAAALGQPVLSGLLFFQDPNAATAAPDTAIINGSSTSSLVGAMYFPNNEVQFSGNTANQSACTMVIGLTVELTGNSNMNVASCADYGVGVPKTLAVNLVE